MDCGLDDIFEKVNGIYVVRAKDGTLIPVLFCPLCGTRIEYEE